jgi:CMP-N-acetylneuraminic acid synthetase|tara:strand:- start:876 stop:1544 length:669 start_codon:yes stop_codon:yes gene_type:complete
MKTLAGIIHARKDSTRCPNKHLRDLNGTTLIDIALEKLSRLDLDEKYLAVYDQELKDKVIDGVKILHREYDSVAPGNCHHSIMYKHLNDVKSDFIVNYNPCQPFLDVDKLNHCIRVFKESRMKSMITVKKNRNFFWDMTIGREPVNFKPNDRLSTTAGPWLYEATHSLVFYEKDYMLKEWELFPNTKDNPHPLITKWDEEEYLDVDTETDFEIVKYFHERQS